MFRSGVGGDRCPVVGVCVGVVIGVGGGGGRPRCTTEVRASSSLSSEVVDGTYEIKYVLDHYRNNLIY